MENKNSKFGQLALEFCKTLLPIEILRSHSGFYIGTLKDDMPFSRESVEYWPTVELATSAFKSGNWTQKKVP